MEDGNLASVRVSLNGEDVTGGTCFVSLILSPAAAVSFATELLDAVEGSEQRPLFWEMPVPASPPATCLGVALEPGSCRLGVTVEELGGGEETVGEPGPSPAAGELEPPPEPVMAEVRKLVRAGKRVAAVWMLRKETGWSLEQSFALVERLRKER